MSHAYRAVQWNAAKRRYDLLAVAAAVLWVATFLVVAALATPAADGTSEAILLMRAFGSGAFALLVVVLSIGPLSRLSPRFAPLLYNRRHLGVLMFLMALAHAAVATVWYHGFGVLDPLTSILASGVPFEGLAGVPFQPFGLAALLLLFAMAATSHDFWLRNLTPATWKALHQSVYVVFAMLVAHVGFGILQDRVWAGYAWATMAAAAWVASLHLVAGVVQHVRDGREAASRSEGWIEVASPESIPMDRARRIVLPDGASVAVFRQEAGYSATSSVCAHQGGPLDEGQILGGCITCPWHGYQYRPQDGQSPPPYTERLGTYELRLEGDRLLLNPRPLPPGTATPSCPPISPRGVA